MSDILDLDAVREAVDDGSRTPLQVKLGGKIYEATRPLPIAAAIALSKGDFLTAMPLIFGKQAKQILAAGIDAKDVRAVTDRLLGGPGEQTASSGSSEPDGA